MMLHMLQQMMLWKTLSDIMSNSGEQYQSYCDNGRISYRLWGTHEILNLSEHYKVKESNYFSGQKYAYA